MQRIDQTIAAGPRKAEGAGVLFLEIDQEAQLEQHPGLLDGVLDIILDQLRTRDTRGPAGDLAARVGPRGLALLVARENGKALAAYAEGLRAAIARQEWKVDGEDLALTASIGVGLFQPPADDAITMISRAKKACAVARHQGGNRVEVYAPAVPPGPVSGDQHDGSDPARPCAAIASASPISPWSPCACAPGSAMRPCCACAPRTAS